MQNHKPISEEKTETPWGYLLDEGQKLVSNRLAQEFKDYQIQMQFHSILPHFVGKWRKLFPRSFPT